MGVTVEYYAAIKRDEVLVCYNVTEALEHYPKWKKPNTEDHMLYDSLYVEMSRVGKFMETESGLVVTPGWEEGWRRAGEWMLMDVWFPFGVMKYSKIDVRMIV